MKISGIFAVVGNSLISVKYSNCEADEFDKTFDNWTDIEYLYYFFLKHEKDLQSGFYGAMTIQNAIEKTIQDAENLEEKLIEIAKQGKLEGNVNLQMLFKPLNNNEYQLRDLQKSKVYGNIKKSWLRIYAIRVDENTFVVSGGAIKLTPTMNKREHLLEELKKLEVTKEYLIENGLLDKDDFEYLELY